MNNYSVSCVLIVRDAQTFKIERIQNCFQKIPARTPREAVQAVIDDLKERYKAIRCPCSVRRLGSLVTKVDGKEYEYCLFNAEITQ